MNSWSSLLFSVCRYYNVTINIGHPPKPYFLDLDTGSDLTWLQCNAPCVHCIEVKLLVYNILNIYMYAYIYILFLSLMTILPNSLLFVVCMELFF